MNLVLIGKWRKGNNPRKKGTFGKLNKGERRHHRKKEGEGKKGGGKIRVKARWNAGGKIYLEGEGSWKQRTAKSGKRAEMQSEND